MAFAQRIITSNSAGDQEFTFTFDYIKEEHIKVFVNFVEINQGTGSSEFQVITNTTPKKVRLNTGLASANTRVEIRRVSSLSTPLVDFEDGSTLTATDLDTAEKQSLFIAQELDDALKQGISIDTSTGVPTLNSQRLSNVSDPVNAQDAVTKAYLERTGSITSTQIADGTIVNADIANTTITGAKLVNDTVTATQIAPNAVTASELANNAVDTNAVVDSAITTAKLNDLSVTTDKIAGQQVTTAKIADNAITSDKINAGAVGTTDIAEDAVTASKLADNAVVTANIVDNAVTTAKLNDLSVTTAKIAGQQVTTTKIADNAVTTAKIADAEIKTLAGMQSGTASKLADSTALTSDIADLNQLDGMAKQTTITDDDTKFPTSGAVVDYVAAQIAPLGGLEVIATDAAFPNTQPSSGVVISISDAGGVAFNGSGTSTTARTVGGATVTINNAPSSLNNETLVAGVGLMVSSTGTGQIYNYHKILGKEDDIKQLSDDINDFNARYRVGSSNPTSDNDAGDLFFNTTTQKLLVYNATNAAWEEAQSIGNFFISTLSPAFNGSLQDFTITNAPTNAQQILLSINGVVQRPNAGTSTPSEGFALSGNTIKLAAAPPSGADYFAVVIGSSVNIGTPSNNTVTSAILQSGSVVEAKIASGAVTQTKIADGAIINAKIDNAAAIAGSKISPSFTSDITITNTSPSIFLTDSDHNPDWSINGGGGNFRIKDETAGLDRLHIGNSGIVNVPSTLTIGSTGNEIEIFFDGTYDRIKANTNTLRLNVDTFVVRTEDDSRHNGFRALNGIAQLYFGSTTITDSVICETADQRLKFNSTSAYIEIPHDDRLLVFDQGQKMITSNDNSGNFNMKGGSGHTNVHINTDGSSESGLAQVTLDSDGVDGKVAIGVGPRRAAGQAANYTLGLTIDYVSSGLNGLKYRTGTSLSPSTLATEYNVIHAGNARDGSWDAGSTAIFKTLGNGGSVALTTNDGGGNANVTFNCAEQVADTDGSSWRIACAVDANNGHFTISNDKVVTNGGACAHTDRFEITESGTFIGSSSNNISDVRLKKNIATISDATNKIKALKGRTFEWKDEADLEPGTQYGFVAQEMELVVSELVSDGKEWGLRGIDKEGNVIYDKSCPDKKKEIVEYTKGVNVSGVVPILVEALKEAIAKIETLETKVTALEAK